MGRFGTLGLVLSDQGYLVSRKGGADYGDSGLGLRKP